MTLVVRMPRERGWRWEHSISAFVIIGDVTHACTSKLINITIDISISLQVYVFKEASNLFVLLLISLGK